MSRKVAVVFHDEELCTDLKGEMTANDNTLEYAVPRMGVACAIKNKMPDSPIAVTLLRDNAEVNRVEGAG